MMLFWFVAILLISIAIVFSVWPWIKPMMSSDGDSEQALESHVGDQWDWISGTEMERSNLELKHKRSDGLRYKTDLRHNRWITKNGVALLIVLTMPVVTIAFYLKLGSSTELAVVNVIKNGALNNDQLETVLNNWVTKRPDNKQAMLMLGSHYLRSGKLDEAVKTYRHLVAVSPHPQVMAELAQVLFLYNDNIITPEVRDLYQQTLENDNNNTIARGLEGIDAFANGNFLEAIAAWRFALTYETDPASRRSFSAGIHHARLMRGEVPKAIKVQIALSDELKDLPETARVIVFARAAGQTDSAPVAAITMNPNDLPTEVLLDESSALMMGEQTLSELEYLDVTVRLSLSGDVMTSDLQAYAKNVKITSTEPVKLLLAPTSE